MYQPKKEQKESSFIIRSLQIYKEIAFRQNTPYFSSNHHFMLTNFPILLSYLLIGFLLTFVLIPPFLKLVIHLKLGKQIRDNALMGKAEMFKLLHEHKAGTPSMGALTILTSMVILIFLSIIAWYFRDSIYNLTGIRINNSLWSREETYLSIFTLVSM